MKKLSVAGLLGFATAILSNYLVGVPPGLEVFHVIGGIGCLAGYPTGEYILESKLPKGWSIFVIVITAILTISVGIIYVTRILMNVSGISAVWCLGSLVALFFFGFGVLIGYNQILFHVSGADE